MILDEEISKLNTGVAQVEHVELRDPSLASPTTALEQFTTLLSWLRLHLAEQRSAGRDVLPNTKVLEGCLQLGLSGKRKSHMWGATT